VAKQRFSEETGSSKKKSTEGKKARPIKQRQVGEKGMCATLRHIETTKCPGGGGKPFIRNYCKREDWKKTIRSKATTQKKKSVRRHQPQVIGRKTKGTSEQSKKTTTHTGGKPEIKGGKPRKKKFRKSSFRSTC